MVMVLALLGGVVWVGGGVVLVVIFGFESGGKGQEEEKEKEFDDSHGIQFSYFNNNIQFKQSIKVRGMEYLGFDDNKKIGLFLLAVSALCYTLGVLFLFRRSFILMANLLFLLGLYFFIGISGILKFFTKKGKVQGSCVYFGGLLVVILGWTFVGVVCQIVGFFIIFRSFLPDFYDYICRLPVVGHYLKSYRIQNALDRLAGNNRI